MKSISLSENQWLFILHFNFGRNHSMIPHALKLFNNMTIEIVVELILFWGVSIYFQKKNEDKISDFGENKVILHRARCYALCHLSIETDTALRATYPIDCVRGAKHVVTCARMQSTLRIDIISNAKTQRHGDNGKLKSLRLCGSAFDKNKT